MADTLIQTLNLTRRFGDVLAVNGLELAVPQGSVYAFLGPNGAVPNAIALVHRSLPSSKNVIGYTP